MRDQRGAELWNIRCNLRANMPTNATYYKIRHECWVATPLNLYRLPQNPKADMQFQEH